MALQWAAVANSIAALSVAGVNLKDIDEIPAKASKREPFIIPLPHFVTDFTHERDSFGIGTVAKQTVEYTLNYRLCYKRAGAGRANIIEYYDEMIAKAALFFDAVMAIDTFTGGVDMVPAGLFNMGIVNDPADNQFIGCDLSVRVTEFVN